MTTQKKSQTKNQIKLIYNPHAGAKRRMFPNPYTTPTSLEDINSLLKKYQLGADFFPTKYPGHAIELAENAQKEGYKMVLVSGGDGTVGEAANGLINSDLTLGILPLGSYMNVAHMLSIPLDLEKAVMLIKLGRTRKIDVGKVHYLGQAQLTKPYYFLESVGFGLEAQMHEYMLKIEHGKYREIIQIIKTLFEYIRYRVEIMIDDKKVVTRATIINIANGPYSGPALPIAPTAKLNDHLLTVSIFKMKNYDLFRYFFNLFFGIKRRKKPTVYQAKKVNIDTKVPRPVHVDARVYGMTPVELSILPNAINVITGYPNPQEEIISLQKRTFLDP
jgi:diacylglycerol kinase (ATP)